MKRKIIALVLTTFMMLGIVGCSAEGLKLYEEMNKTATWEAVETTGNMLITTEIQGEKVELGAEVSGYTNTKERQSYVEVNIKTFKYSGADAGIKMSPVKVYMDGQSIYISKTYFTDLMQIAGVPTPDVLKNITAEYIGIDASAGTEKVLVNQEATIALMESLFKNSKVKVPVVQKGREYTIDLDGDQMVDLSAQFITELLGNIDLINKVSDTGITQKDIDAQKKEMEVALTEGKAMAKPMLKGSKAMLKYSFEDNAYKQNMNVALKVAVGEEKINLNIVVDSSAKKISKKEFKLPTSKVLYTKEDIIGLLMAIDASAEEIVQAEISKTQVITKNKEMHLPLRDTMDQLGLTVSYDAKTKKVSVSSGNESVVVKVISQKGITYIAVSELEKLGLTILEDKNVVLVIANTL